MAVAFTAGDTGGAVVLYTLKAPTTTLAPATLQPTPPAHHGPLPLTGAPVTFELMGALGLLLAGALAALSARRRTAPAVRPAEVPVRRR